MGPNKIGKAVEKARLLLRLLPKHPQEFYDRVLTFFTGRLEGLCLRSATYEPQQWHPVLDRMGRSLGRSVRSFLDEPAVTEIMEEVCRRKQLYLAHLPFSLVHNGDFALARMCYLACRAIKPAVVLETGVAYGVTSSFILKALEVNGCGLLYSVDLPPLGHDADRFVGILIPETLRHRWRLHRGVSKRILPQLLPQLEHVDIFVHDSLHTYKNMRWELQLVTTFLRRPAIVVADDVEHNAAFLEWAQRTPVACWAALPEVEKSDLLGVGVLP